MALVITNLGEEWFLQLALNLGNYTLKLYQNNPTVGLTAAQKDLLVNANFTEATFTGYAAKTLTGGSWSTSGTDPRQAAYAQQTFTRTSTGATQTIYGYTVHRTSDGLLCWFEDFAGPISTTTNGDTIRVTPIMTLDDDQEATVTARGVQGTPFSSTTLGTTYTTTTVTDMVVNNFDATSDRNYVIRMNAACFTTGAGTWFSKLYIDGADVARLGALTGASGNTDGYHSGAYLWQPATGQYDLAVAAVELSGTASFTYYADSVDPRQFWVEDVGPR